MQLIINLYIYIYTYIYIYDITIIIKIYICSVINPCSFRTALKRTSADLTHIYIYIYIYKNNKQSIINHYTSDNNDNSDYNNNRYYI